MTPQSGLKCGGKASPIAPSFTVHATFWGAVASAGKLHMTPAAGLKLNTGGTDAQIFGDQSHGNNHCGEPKLAPIHPLYRSFLPAVEPQLRKYCLSLPVEAN